MKNSPGAHLSIVMPVFNEADSLRELNAQLDEALAGVNDVHERVFVDDGSTDDSKAILKQICDSRQDCKLISLRRNFGKSVALSAGFALARGDIIITMDTDLQDDPAEIPRLLAKLDEGYDLVTGQKANRQDPLTKRIPSKIANFVTRTLSGVPIEDMNSGFKCYRAEVVQQLYLHGDLHRYIPIIAHFKGFRVTEIPVHHRARQFGRSKYGISRFFRGFMDLLTVLFIGQYSRRPLHLFGGVGIVMGGLGLLINIYLSLLWFSGQAIGDRPLLLLGILLIIVGIQFVIFGLMSDLIIIKNQRPEDVLFHIKSVYPEETDES